MNCAIIPARGGSKGIPGKNLMLVGGLTLVERAIRASQLAMSVDTVVVSTDDESIAEVAAAAGARIVHRPAELAGDQASSESALLHTLDVLASQGDEPARTVFLQCTSPFTEPEDIDRTVGLLDLHDCAFTAARSHRFLWRKGASASAVGVNHSEAQRLPRQQLDPEWVETGAVYAMRTAGFRATGHRFFGRIGICEVPASRSMEIDEPEDLDLARHIAALRPSTPLMDALIGLSAVVFDFDGVMTDDRVIVDQDGTESVICSRSDGMGVEMLRRAGLSLLILSKETNPVVAARAQKLDVEAIQGCNNKAERLERWSHEKGIPLDRCAYLGNDINDLECMSLVRVAVAPADAHPRARAAADLVLNRDGGRGAVREFAELLALPQVSTQPRG